MPNTNQVELKVTKIQLQKITKTQFSFKITQTKRKQL